MRLVGGEETNRPPLAAYVIHSVYTGDSVPPGRLHWALIDTFS